MSITAQCQNFPPARLSPPHEASALLHFLLAPPPHTHTQGMKGWVFLLPTVTKEDAEAYFPDHKVCQVPSGKGEDPGLGI